MNRTPLLLTDALNGLGRRYLRYLVRTWFPRSPIEFERVALGRWNSGATTDGDYVLSVSKTLEPVAKVPK
jgi:hypothetical protein